MKKLGYIIFLRTKVQALLFWAAICIGLCANLCSVAFAAPVLPGPADAGRIGNEGKMTVPDRSEDNRVAIPSIMPSVPIPEGADKIHFVLKAVHIEGLTAFTTEQMADIYAPYIGKKIGLDVTWKIVGEITKRYRDAGYFLSRAYIPEQRIKDGIITIRIVEGYVKKVDLEMPDDIYAYRLIKIYIARLVAQKPVDTDAVESFLLRINDLPGYSFRGVLSTLDEKSESADAVKLTLVPSKEAGKGTITFDNYSSRYLNPNEISAAYSTSLFPLQKTTVSGITDLSGDKLQHAAINHVIAFAPKFTLEVGADITNSYPGFTLSRFDINSQAISENISLNYQWIRQRQKNLALKFTLDNRDVTTDALNSPLTRDHIHAFRTGAIYDANDSWDGYNILSSTFSQGLEIANSDQKNNRYASRSGAVPNFSKVEWAFSRLQNIVKNWSVFAATSGQWSSDVLYSSEQFGYGGQSFGRAYDTSEITGDKGLAGSLELRYGGYNELEPIGIQPFVFLDAGQVWNKAVDQPKSQSGASAGLGMRYTTQWHQFGNLSLAWPLTRDISTPIYGGSEHGPRLIFQMTQEF